MTTSENEDVQISIEVMASGREEIDKFIKSLSTLQDTVKEQNKAQKDQAQATEKVASETKKSTGPLQDMLGIFSKLNPMVLVTGVGLGAFGATVRALDEQWKRYTTTGTKLTGMMNLLSTTNVKYGDVMKRVAKESETWNIADEKLLSAYQILLPTTKEMTVAQGILSNAVKVHKNTGIELIDVVNDMNSAYAEGKQIMGEDGLIWVHGVQAVQAVTEEYLKSGDAAIRWRTEVNDAWDDVLQDRKRQIAQFGSWVATFARGLGTVLLDPAAMIGSIGQALNTDISYQDLDWSDPVEVEAAKTKADSEQKSRPWVLSATDAMSADYAMDARFDRYSSGPAPGLDTVGTKDEELEAWANYFQKSSPDSESDRLRLFDGSDTSLKSGYLSFDEDESERNKSLLERFDGGEAPSWYANRYPQNIESYDKYRSFNRRQQNILGSPTDMNQYRNMEGPAGQAWRNYQGTPGIEEISGAGLGQSSQSSDMLHFGGGSSMMDMVQPNEIVQPSIVQEFIAQPFEAAYEKVKSDLQPLRTEMDEDYNAHLDMMLNPENTQGAIKRAWADSEINIINPLSSGLTNAEDFYRETVGEMFEPEYADLAFGTAFENFPQILKDAIDKAIEEGDTHFEKVLLGLHGEVDIDLVAKYMEEKPPLPDWMSDTEEMDVHINYVEPDGGFNFGDEEAYMLEVHPEFIMPEEGFDFGDMETESSNAFADFGQWVWDAMKTGWDTITSIEFWKAVGTLLNPLTLGTKVAEGFSGFGQWVWDNMKTGWTNITSVEYWKSVGTLLNPVTNAQKIWEGWSDTGKWVWNAMEGGWDTITSIEYWKAVGTLLNPVTNAKKVVLAFGDFGTWAWTEIKAGLQHVQDNMPSKLQNIYNAIVGKFQAALTKAKEVLASIVEAYNSLPIFPDVPNIFSDGGGGGADVPDGKPDNFDSTLRPDLLGGYPPIKAGAEGGIVDKPTLLLAGEEGPEKLTPLGKGNSEPMIIKLYLDGKQIKEVVLKEFDDDLRLQGAV